MVRYVAFLRAINVGGRKLIRMEDLTRVLLRAGLANVRTYIQSGNVIFDSEETDATALAKRIENALLKALGHEVTVVLRTNTELENILEPNSFKRVKPGDDVMLFVTFLASQPSRKPRLPLISTTEKLEAFQIRGGAAFIVARRKKNGRFGFPNNFVEKALGVSATTRNWSTVSKIAALAKNAETNRDFDSDKRGGRKATRL